MIDYKWKIEQLERTNDEAQGVITVHWSVTATEDGLSAREYGTTHHQPEPNSGTFIPFDELTEATILGWVFEIINKDVSEQTLKSKIEKKKNPPTVSGLPWSTVVVESEEVEV